MESVARESYRFSIRKYRVLPGAILLACIWWSGCAKSTPPQSATLTLKKDGSLFSGTVVRREPQSITLTTPSGETKTFLNSEITAIQVGTQGDVTNFSPAAVTRPSDSQARGSASPATVIRIPQGTEIPVRNNGVLDACCLPINSIALGVMDGDVKSADGKVLVPNGANVTIMVRDKKRVEGRVTMEFELGSADFDNQHYLVSSEKGTEPGAVVTFVGAQEGSQEAKIRGLWVHLSDRTYMAFKAATPTVFTPSK
jgi:hypothetical protein